MALGSYHAPVPQITTITPLRYQQTTHVFNALQILAVLLYYSFAAKFCLRIYIKPALLLSLAIQVPSQKVGLDPST